ncbi:MAG: hypothetical protein ACLRNQ_20870 [Flavonifractor plautii]
MESPRSRWAGPCPTSSAWAGEAGTPETAGALSVLTGSAPVAGLRDYGREVAAYTRGRGRLSCTAGGYAPATTPMR